MDLSSLKTINLSGSRVASNCVYGTGADFFYPVRKVLKLNVTDTDFFFGDQRVLSVFEQLEVLDIGFNSPYRRCPKDADTLLNNLPPTLAEVYMRRWRAEEPASASCALDRTSLDGLKHLTNLTLLSFQYSDRVFGIGLGKDLFNGFKKLRSLDIRFCGLTTIESGAFSGLNLLEDLFLAGNPIGSRNIQPFGPTGAGPHLIFLDLTSTDIISDNTLQYRPFKMLMSMPKLKELSLSRNFIHAFDAFHLETIFNFQNLTHRSITHLTLDDNFISALSDHFFGSDYSCSLFPCLTHLNVRRNGLKLIGELCPNLKHLDLGQNKLFANYDKNLNAIRQLRWLQYLSIRDNRLRNLSEGLLSSMDHLTYVDLSKNELSHLSRSLFARNVRLKQIDLSWNLLTTIDEVMFSKMSTLESVDLSNNRLPAVTPEMTSFVDSHLALTTFKISGNPFNCGCGMTYFQDWLKKTAKVPEVKYFKCSFPSSMMAEYVYSFVEDEFQCRITLPLMIFGSIFGGLLLTMMCVLPCYKYRWYLGHPRVVARAVIDRLRMVRFEHTCMYDAFISYNNDDEQDSDWVTNVLLPSVEEERENQTVCYIYRMLMVIWFCA